MGFWSGGTVMLYCLQFPSLLGYSVPGKHFRHTKIIEWTLTLTASPSYNVFLPVEVVHLLPKPGSLMPFDTISPNVSQVSRNKPLLPGLFYYILITVFYLGGGKVGCFWFLSQFLLSRSYWIPRRLFKLGQRTSLPSWVPFQDAAYNND